LPTKKRKIIVEAATSADGYIARPDGDIEWLTSHPNPKGMYGMAAFIRTIDTILYGRKTYEFGVQMGVTFDRKIRHYVFSRQAPPPSVPPGVKFVSEPVREFARRLRATKGKDIWMMGGAEIIGAFLDEEAIDEFRMTMIPVLIGEGIPLVAPRHRYVPLRLKAVRSFPDGVVQVHYEVGKKPRPKKRK
jgi:dihydrofolate reductase